MYGKFQQYLKDELAAIEAAGLYKKKEILHLLNTRKLHWRTDPRH